eukprot:3939254-Rhodomonas_salina.1
MAALASRQSPPSSVLFAVQCPELTTGVACRTQNVDTTPSRKEVSHVSAPPSHFALEAIIAWRPDTTWMDSAAENLNEDEKQVCFPETGIEEDVDEEEGRELSILSRENTVINDDTSIEISDGSDSEEVQMDETGFLLDEEHEAEANKVEEQNTNAQSEGTNLKGHVQVDASIEANQKENEQKEQEHEQEHEEHEQEQEQQEQDEEEEEEQEQEEEDANIAEQTPEASSVVLFGVESLPVMKSEEEKGKLRSSLSLLTPLRAVLTPGSLSTSMRCEALAVHACPALTRPILATRATRSTVQAVGHQKRSHRFDRAPSRLLCDVGW